METARWYVPYSPLVQGSIELKRMGPAEQKVGRTLGDRGCASHQCVSEREQRPGLNIRNAEHDLEWLLESVTPLPKVAPSPLDGFPLSVA